MLDTIKPGHSGNASSLEDAPLGGHEAKFIITAKRAGGVLRHLDRLCRPDPVYPEAVVTSIYFDTRGLHCVYEKLNSDYLKTKLRLRWYRLPDSPPAPGDPVFAEAKFRIGNRRRKVRTPAPFEASWLQNVRLETPRLLSFSGFMQSLGVVVRHALLPALMIEYRRRRYIDPLTGARLCVDTAIRVPRVNRMLLPRTLPGTLDTAVVELKGDFPDLPQHLYSITDLGCRRASWSKYGACYQKLVGYTF
jgi:hypothetical protein